MTSNSIICYHFIEIPHESRLALVICWTNRMQEKQCVGIFKSIMQSLGASDEVSCSSWNQLPFKNSDCHEATRLKSLHINALVDSTN